MAWGNACFVAMATEGLWAGHRAALALLLWRNPDHGGPLGDREASVQGVSQGHAVVPSLLRSISCNGLLMKKKREEQTINGLSQ